MNAILNLFLAHFVIITGIYVLPRLPNQSSFLILSYAISIIVIATGLIYEIMKVRTSKREGTR